MDRITSERQRAERLFEVTEGLYRIPLPTDFPVGDVNVYFLDGPDPVLVDTGVTGKRTLACLAEALDALGRGISSLRTVLLTHTHVDHAGAARAIRELAGCEVRAHPRGIERLDDVEAKFERDAPWFLEFVRRSGLSAEVVEKYTSMSRVFLRYLQSCPGILPVRGGEVLELGGGRRLAVHEAFGHTTNQVVYLLEDAGVLFTGDHVLPEITSNPTLEAPGSEDREKLRPLVLYQESLSRIGALPAKIACPGHGRPFADLAGRCREIALHQRDRAERVRSLLQAGGRMTRKDLSLALFGRVRLWDLYLTLSEVQAAVELLEAEGKVRVLSEGEVDWIEASPSGDSARA